MRSKQTYILTHVRSSSHEKASLNPRLLHIHISQAQHSYHSPLIELELYPKIRQRPSIISAFVHVSTAHKSRMKYKAVQQFFSAFELHVPTAELLVWIVVY